MDINEDLLQNAVDLALKHGAREVIAKLIISKEHQIRISNSAIDVLKQWNQK